MKLYIFFFIFLVFSAKSLEKTLILSPGERVFLDRPSNQTLTIGDKSLVAIKPMGEKISLLARKRGQTRLLSGSQSYQLYILDPDLKIKASHLDSLLKKMKGLNWTVKKLDSPTAEASNKLNSQAKFIIGGELYRFSDWLSLKKAFEKHSIKYEFKPSMDKELKKISSYYFNKQLKKDFEILWGDLPFTAVPEGSPLSYYQKKLSPFGLRVRERENWFFNSPLLEIEFAVVESLSSSSFFSGGNLNKELSGFTSLLSFLNFLKSSGKGKSLHHSSLLAQSGKSIELESGGQIPISSFNLKSEQQSASWKSHGLKLKLKAQMGVKQQIFLQIQARLSEPLALKSPSGSAPPLKNQTLETEMVLEAGRIFKLFELKKKSKGRAYQGGLSFLLTELNLFNGSQNKYDMTQFILVRINILDSKSSSVISSSVKALCVNPESKKAGDSC